MHLSALEWTVEWVWSVEQAVELVYFWLHHTVQGWNRGRWVGVTCTWSVAARLGCQSTMVGTGWANSCPGCMDTLRKHYSHLVGCSFLARNAAWALSRCLTTESADYCILVDEWAWLKSRVCLNEFEVVQPVQTCLNHSFTEGTVLTG